LYVRALVVASLLSLICSLTHADTPELIPIVLNIKAKAAKKEKLLKGGQYFSLEQFHTLTAADAEEWIQVAFEKIEDPKLLIEKVDGVEGCVSYPKPYKAEAPGQWLELTQFAFYRRNGHWVVTRMYWGISPFWHAVPGDLCKRTEWPWSTPMPDYPNRRADGAPPNKALERTRER